MTNPVLVNDLRKSWFRRRPVQTAALMAIIILVLTLFVGAGISSVFGFTSNTHPFWRFPDLLLPVVAPAFAAGAFAKEHEQRTWQDLLLTRLSAGEIVFGKFFACLFPTIAVVIVLMPPFAMILILSSVQWAQEPGLWMVAVALRFLVLAVFYLSVGLVCSYHSTDARTSLVVGYVVLALYGIVSFFVWRTVIFTTTYTFYQNGSGQSFSEGQTNGLLTLSRYEFGFSVPDLVFMVQSIVICSALFGYLLLRVRNRRNPIL